MEHTARCRELHADLDRVGDAFAAALTSPVRDYQQEEIRDMGRTIGAIHEEIDTELATCPGCIAS